MPAMLPRPSTRISQTTRRVHRTRIAASICSLSVVLVACNAEVDAVNAGRPSEIAAWRSDAAWNRGPAEWAVYDAKRTIYGESRSYTATLWTNTEHLDSTTGIKIDDGGARNAIRVFKHNLSEIIPAGNYDYRFLTTAYVGVDTLTPVVLTMSSQEDCGATFRRFFARDRRVHVEDHCYFPGTGHRQANWPLRDDIVFHDMLSLVLRDYPFPAEAIDAPEPRVIRLVADQTTNLAPPLEPAPATIEYVGLERLDLPIGTIDAHHLRVRHELMGGASESNYWMAADPDLLHVMVRHDGPYDVRYELKDLGWWAYWADDEPTRIDPKKLVVSTP